MFNFPDGYTAQHFTEIHENYLSKQELKSYIWQYIEDNSAYEDLFQSTRFSQLLCDDLYESQKVSLHPFDMQILVAEVIKEQLVKLGYKL